MKCFYHNDRDAVAQCSECGKFLCSECAEGWKPTLCPSCGEAVSSNNKSNSVASLILAVILFIIGAAFAWGMCAADGTEPNFGGILFIGYMVAAVPSGWRTLSGLTSKFFLVLPVVGWIFYFGIKLSIASLVGIIALPVEIVKFVRTLKRG